MKTKQQRCLIRGARSVLLLPLVIGCGGDDSVTLDSGLNESTPVTELSSTQIDQLCQAAAEATASLSTSDVCALIAFSEGDSAQECEQFMSMCTEYASWDTEQLKANCVEEFDQIWNTPEPDRCHATVGQIEGCANEIYAVFPTLADEFPCSDAGDPERHNALQTQADASTPTCQEIEAAYDGCPEIPEF